MWRTLGYVKGTLSELTKEVVSVQEEHEEDGVEPIQKPAPSPSRSQDNLVASDSELELHKKLNFQREETAKYQRRAAELQASLEAAEQQNMMITTEYKRLVQEKESESMGWKRKFEETQKFLFDAQEEKAKLMYSSKQMGAPPSDELLRLQKENEALAAQISDLQRRLSTPPTPISSSATSAQSPIGSGSGTSGVPMIGNDQFEVVQKRLVEILGRAVEDLLKDKENGVENHLEKLNATILDSVQSTLSSCIQTQPQPLSPSPLSPSPATSPTAHIPENYLALCQSLDTNLREISRAINGAGSEPAWAPINSASGAAIGDYLNRVSDHLRSSLVDPLKQKIDLLKKFESEILKMNQQISGNPLFVDFPLSRSGSSGGSGMRRSGSGSAVGIAPPSAFDQIEDLVSAVKSLTDHVGNMSGWIGKAHEILYAEKMCEDIGTSKGGSVAAARVLVRSGYLDGVRASLQRAAEDRKQASELNGLLMKKLETLESQKQNLMSSRDESDSKHEQQVVTLKRQLDDLMKRLEMSDGRAANLEDSQRTIKALQERCSELEQDNQTKELSISKLNHQLKDQRFQLQELKMSYTDGMKSTEEDRKKLERDSERLKASLSEHAAQLTASQETIIQQQNEIAQLRHEVDQLTQKMKKSVESAQAQISDLRREVESKGDECRKGALALANLQLVLEQFQAEQESTIQMRLSALQTALDSALQQAEFARQEAAQVEALREEMRTTEDKRSNVEQELQEKTRFCTSLQLQISSLRRALEESVNKLSDDDIIERSTVKKLVLAYFEGRSRSEAAELLARVLNFTEDEKISAGLKKDTSGKRKTSTSFLKSQTNVVAAQTPASAAPSPPVTPGSTSSASDKKNLADMWVEFLLNEADEGSKS